MPGEFPQALAERAQRALQSGRFDEARELGEELERVAPQSPLGPFAIGVAAFKSLDFNLAVTQLSRAVARNDAAQNSRFWLADALHHAGRFRDALNAYDEAARLGGGDAIAHNRRLVEEDMENDRRGRNSVHRDRSNPEPEHLADILTSAHSLAARAILAPRAQIAEPSGDVPSLSIVTCSITPWKLARLRASLATSLAGRDWELIAITDAKSLCDGYNRGFARARGELIVFCHDDIEILCDRFFARLIDAVRDADVIGVCGTTKLTGPALGWSGAPHFHCAISHLDATTQQCCLTLCSTAGPRIDEAQALDGVFFAAWRHAVEQVGFDAETFDGFDLYDLDFTYRAFKVGLRIRIQTDLHLLHLSRGNFGQRYAQYAERFRAKHPEFRDAPPPAFPVVRETRLADGAEAQRAHDWIDTWLRSAPELR
ncbi:MAG TPA: glycosyltransferase [Rudaea sp.]|jgi:tetratricopeptide (TPR) repeat protein|nr:glycosyltransferase [Rudaea sp.]